MDLEQFLKEGTIVSIDRDIVLVGWGKRLWRENPDSNLPSFYFPDFFLKNPKPWFTHMETCVISLSEFIVILESRLVTKKPRWLSLEWKLYDDEFLFLKKCLQNRILLKAVLYVFAHAYMSFDASTLLHSLRHAATFLLVQKAHIYGFWNEIEGMLGVTPELLFNIVDPEKCVETLACAGTSHSGSGGRDIFSDPKECYEHRLVIDGIIHSTRSFAKIEEGDSSLQMFGSLSHIVTPLKMHIFGSPSFKDLVESLHPTPALGAYPKDVGKIWLEGYAQKLPRGRYGAPVGYHLPNDGKKGCLVAIRNIQWNSKENHSVISLGAGSGIVFDSQLETEREEVGKKIEVTKKILGL